MWIIAKTVKVVNMNEEIMPKKRVYATIREELVNWLDEEIKKLRFANRSHGIEVALQKLKEQLSQEKAK
jgi:metal-responsive CopG/Arc/MetJ family transcriptional regulator